MTQPQGREDGQLSLLDVPMSQSSGQVLVSPGLTECDLSACRICTGCAHSNHGACRLTVRCIDDGQVRTCSCCGGN